MVFATRSIVFLLFFLALVSSALAETAAPTPDPIADAERLMKAKKHKEAIPVLAEVAASNPESAPQALKMMGECYKVRKNWAKAIECYERLLAEHPDSVAPDQEIRTWILDCYLADSDLDNFNKMRGALLKGNRKQVFQVHYVTGRRHMWMHKHSKAIPELEKAVANARLLLNDDPDELDANKRLLDCYIQTKEWEKARALAERLARDYPDEGYQWHYAMGKCLLDQQEYDQAIESLKSAAESVPAKEAVSKSIFKALLDCYYSTGRSAEGVSFAQQLVEDNPKEPSWRWEMARFHHYRREYDKAVPLFKSVVESSTRQWEIRSSQIYMGEGLFKLGKGDEALESIERYYKERPELWDEHLLVKAAVLYHGAHDYEGCLAVARELIAKSEKGKNSALVPTANELVRGALGGLEDFSQLARVYEEMAIESNDPRLMYRAGENYAKAGDYTEAIRMYRMALRQGGISDMLRADTMYDLAVSYWNTGLKNAAQRLASQVVERYPDAHVAARARGSLYLWQRGE